MGADGALRTPGPRLSADEAALFEQRLDDCDGCRMYLEQMRAAIVSVGRIGEADVPAEMRDRMLAAFRERRWPER